MPYQDEEYPGQPLWQSVLLFCCKGMIEGIMVILFFWLLVQVLFTKQLEVHLQVLLLVGLIAFCLSLVLGCVICCRKSQIFSRKDKAPIAPLAQTEHVSTSGAPQQLYEHLHTEGLEYPSTFSSPGPSQRDFNPHPFGDQAQADCENYEHAAASNYFSLRRLSSPLLQGPAYKPMHSSRASLPSLPKLGLLTKASDAPQRRCTLPVDSRPYTERSRLTTSRAISPSILEKPIPLAPLSYGSNTHSRPTSSLKPCLHFTMAFSPEQQTLTVIILDITELTHRIEDVTFSGSLPPLHPKHTQILRECSSRTGASLPVLLLKVPSLKELQICRLILTLHTHGVQEEPAQVQVDCGEVDWTLSCPLHFTKELCLKAQTVK